MGTSYIWREKSRSLIQKSNFKPRSDDDMEYLLNILQENSDNRELMVRLIWNHLWRIDTQRWKEILGTLKEGSTQIPLVSKVVNEVEACLYDRESVDSKDDRKEMLRALLSYIWRMDSRRWKSVMEVLKEGTKGIRLANSVVIEIWMHLERDGCM